MTHPPLTPWPLDVLLGRVASEWQSRHRIFDLPTGRVHQLEPPHDLSVDIAGHHAATPLGPAAGPHTQLAQNYVLGWLAGARVFEMKTVQVMDDLEIPRPCIDMELEGYNVEWSQELAIDRSLEEYVKAWMMLEILGGWEELRPLIGRPGSHVFDVSVGYDLAGITSPKVEEYLHTLIDASTIIDDLRDAIPEPFARFRDHYFPTRITGGATLSTFHGCPPEEIEAIAMHVMDHHGLDVTVKLNPTLLGYDVVAGIVRNHLGYDHVTLSEDAFASDLQFDQATGLIQRLEAFARQRGRTFGVKLTNTLVVENTRGRLPGELAYLSGAPLHVIAVGLLDRLVDAMPGTLRIGPDGGPVAVSFSAGIDDQNFADAVGFGMAPVTVCSYLLKPGGYGNLSSMLKRLTRSMQEAACTSVPDWIEHRHTTATADGHRDAVSAYAAALATADGSARYHLTGQKARRRVVDRPLERWDCVSCNLCVTVCPNDAMLHVATPEGIDGLDEKWQYFCLAEWCNECGNCTTFCPEDGEPWLVKPRVYLDEERFAAAKGPALRVDAADGGLRFTVGEQMVGDEALIDAVLGGSHGLPVRAGDL